MFFFAEVVHEVSVVDAVFKNNIINWLLLIAFLIYGWRKVVPGMLDKRAGSIEEAIASARKGKEESEAFLLAQSQQLENAQKDVEKILAEADTVAKQLTIEIQAQTKREVADLEHKLAAALDNERRTTITAVRTAAVKAAMELSKSYLENNVSEEDNKRLLSQFMQELDSLTPQGESFTPGTALGVSSRSDS